MKWNLYTCLFLILPRNNQKPIRNTCRNNLWSTPILMLWNVEFKILRKNPGDEAFRVSFKFPRRGWDQGLAEFNTFLSVQTRSCYSCLVLYHHVKTKKLSSFLQRLEILMWVGYIRMEINILSRKIVCKLWKIFIFLISEGCREV